MPMRVVRALESLALVSGLLLASHAATPCLAQTAPAEPIGQAEASSVLTNVDVVQMLKSGFADSTVIAVIQKAKTRFDLTSAALAELRYAGVPDSVIVAMVESAGAAPNAPAPPAPPAPVVAAPPPVVVPAPPPPLFLEVGGRYAKLSPFEGSYHYAWWDSTDGPSNTDRSNATLYTYEYLSSSDSAWHKSINAWENEPSGSTYRNVSEANVDFSGAQFRFGFAISF
jgi:hypothetical protein